MLLVLTFVVGAVLGFFCRGWRSVPRKANNAPVAPVAPVAPAELVAATEPSSSASAAPDVEPQGFAGRLQALRTALGGIGESTSHPRELRGHPVFLELVNLLCDPRVTVDTLVEYACGNHWITSCAASAALTERLDGPAAATRFIPRLNETAGWEIYFALDYVARLPQRPAVGAVVLNPSAYWAKNPLIRSFFAEHFAQREALGDKANFDGQEDRLKKADYAVVEELLAAIAHPFARTLTLELQRFRAGQLDRQFLGSIGTFWASADDDLLIEHEAIGEVLSSCEAALTAAPARSVLLVGEARTGKTSVARCVARRLAADGYAVFEAGAAELMAGQIHIGELEGRLRRILDELAVTKRVIWFVPSLLKLATSGTHRGQSASILDQVLPAIVAGRLVIVSECPPSALTILQQRWPILRTCLEVLRLQPIARPAMDALAAEFAQRLGREQGLAVDSRVVALAGELASQYLSALQPPGAVLDLLELAGNWSVASGSQIMSRENLLSALSQATGLPLAILDNDEKIEVAGIRRFFDERVIGQSDAVRAVVERIAILKAGLTDTSRPVAVFLFAGPTGTGKTELAKTLAQFLFGSVDRMVRLDMSEFQSYDSTRKILGATEAESESESLIQKIRKQPFSVVLLDEFEKAHQSVWDLFLQVFDDGRLTDAAGQTADFRQTFIVMTSNIGATSHQGSGVGFAPRNDQFVNQQVMRAVTQSFRPEFVNRLDKVIVFQPLTREHMRAILQKELGHVLERRGIKNREWAVEWESSALDFLLERGFDAQMGARPLKRAIEQYVVAPLASNIVEHRFPSGEQFLFVRGTGDGIEVEFVDPDATGTDDGTAAVEANLGARQGPARALLARAALNPTGSGAEHEELRAAFVAIRRTLEESSWQELRGSLLSRMAAPDFWDHGDRARVHARFALIDRVEAAARTSGALKDRYDRGLSGRAGRFSKDLAQRFAQQLFLVANGVDDAFAGPPQEVVLAVEPLFEASTDHGSVSQWSADIAEMYRGWAKIRRMQVSQVTEARPGVTVLVVNGFGAAACLTREAGLHVLEADAASGSTASPAGRATVRVSVGVRDLSETSSDTNATSLLQWLSGGVRNAAVVRRYRFGAAPLVRDAVAHWRSGRVTDVMAGNFDLLSAASLPEA